MNKFERAMKADMNLVETDREAVVLDAAICRAARALLNWSVSRLAREAILSTTLIFDLERGRPVDPATYHQLHRAFTAAGVVILEENNEQVGVRFEPEDPNTAPSD